MSLATVERFFSGDYTTQTCLSEQAYYDLWHGRGLHTLPPSDSAIAGGLLADRLAWVFAAGYQATLRNAFAGLPPRGWAAFAATEDAGDPVAHPPVTLDGDALNGCKAWVAHSRLVDHLIITINDPAGDKRAARGVIVERDRDGVSLSHRENPGFLAAISQGFVRLERTPVDNGAVFPFEAIRQFGRTEAKFVMLAASAFLIAHTGRDAALHDSLVALAASIVALLGETDTSRQVYAAIDREFQRCVDRFEDTTATAQIPDYAADRRLFRLYTDRIQRRQAYAQAEAVAGGSGRDR
jgi:hypothetical protein